MVDTQWTTMPLDNTYDWRSWENYPSGRLTRGDYANAISGGFVAGANPGGFQPMIDRNATQIPED
jgi:hypothetical protein